MDLVCHPLPPLLLEDQSPQLHTAGQPGDGCPLWQPATETAVAMLLVGAQGLVWPVCVHQGHLQTSPVHAAVSTSSCAGEAAGTLQGSEGLNATVPALSPWHMVTAIEQLQLFRDTSSKLFLAAKSFPGFGGFFLNEC